jgi:hypothetical protein
MVPVVMETGISSGYLRPADGLVRQGTGPGVSRGGINWNGVMYRVMGTKLIQIDRDGTYDIIGDVGGTGQCTLDYSFDRLAVSSGGNLFYWDGVTLTQVTDPDLGTVVDFCWIDGYFVSTDGESLVVTELNDPTSVNPLKYGSSEIDPDPINSIMKLRNEIYAVNRYTIEVYSNVGGDFFPFQRIEGAQIQRGAIGTYASCVFIDTIAFLGSGRNESPGVFLGINGGTQKISTREIDELLSSYSEEDLELAVVETKNGKDHLHLWVRLPDRTVVFDAQSSKVLGTPVWFQLTSAIEGFESYRAKDLVWCYDKWNIGEDPVGSDFGYLSDGLSSQWGDIVRWEFGTSIVYNGGTGAIFNTLELVGLTGRNVLGTDPMVSTSYSTDGVVWSNPRSIKAGKSGERNKRLVWFSNGVMQNWRIQKFYGDSQVFASFARLEAQIEPLAV